MSNRSRIYQTVPTVKPPEPQQLKFLRDPSTCKSHPPTRIRIQLPGELIRLRIGRVNGGGFWICEMCGGFLMREADGLRAMTPDDYDKLYEKWTARGRGQAEGEEQV